MKGTIITRVLVDGRWTLITGANRAALGKLDAPRRYDVRYRDLAGKQKARTFDRQKDAARFLAEVVRRVHDRTYVDVRPALMGQVFDRWLTHSLDVRVKEGSLAASTARSYRSMVSEHLRPALGDVRSDNVTGAVEAWRAGLAAKVGTGEIAPKFLVNIRALLNTILKWARHPERAYLATDPIAGLERLRLPKSKRRPHYEPGQVVELLRLAADSPPDDVIIRVVALSGLRRGEAFALGWPDVEWGDGQAGGRLHVRGTLDAVTGAVVRTKTQDSERAVDVPQPVLDALAVHQLTCPPMGAGFVFRDAEGRPLDPDRWHKQRLVPLLKQAGLRVKGTGLHSLRHSYVSLLAAQGADLRYIADQVGHSTTKLTADLYTHVLKQARADAMRRLGNALPYNGHTTEGASKPGNTVEHREEREGADD
jgi:integrase